MKKLSGLLAVSLVAVMMAPAARADIASTAYVDKNMEAKANKVTDVDNYTGDEDSTDKYPSMAVASQMAKKAAAQNAAGKLDNVFTNNKNQVMVTDANGAVKATAVDTAGEGNAVTSVTVTGGKYTVTKGTTFATKAELNTVETTADNTASAVNNATTGLAATRAIADKNKTDIAAMDTAYKAADTAINTALAGKQDKLTAGTGIKIDATTNTISTDGLATNSDLTALQKTVSGHTTSINRLDGADSVNGSVKQQIKTVKSDLTTSIQANATAAADAKTAADAAQKTANAKQDKLVASGENANIAGDDGVSVSIGTNGKITVKGNQTAIDTALAGKIPVPSATNDEGTLVLTYNTKTKAYAWEKIGR